MRAGNGNLLIAPLPPIGKEEGKTKCARRENLLARTRVCPLGKRGQAGAQRRTGDLLLARVPRRQRTLTPWRWKIAAASGACSHCTKAAACGCILALTRATG